MPRDNRLRADEMDTVLILLEDVMDPNVTFKLFIVDIENDAYVQAQSFIIGE